MQDEIELPPTESLLPPETSDREQVVEEVTPLSTTPSGMQPCRNTSQTLSATMSDSSDEVIVFVGRQRSPQRISAGSRQRAPEGLATAAGFARTDKLSSTQSEPPSQSLRKTSPGTNIAKTGEPHGSILGQSSLANAKNEKSSKPTSGIYQSDNSDSDAFLADYMDNMRAHGEIDDDFVSQAQASQPDNVDGWDRSDLADFDDLTTSVEIADVLEAVLAKRKRASGVQYLVVWQGQSVDEARWIHHESLTMHGANESIQVFEEQEILTKHAIDNAHSSPDFDSEAQSEEDDDDYDDEDEELSNLDDDFEDERDIIERRIARMTDEQIARLLSKQEELGMGSDDLILFDDLGAAVSSDRDAENEDFIAFTSTRRSMKPKHARQRHSRSAFEPFLGSANDLLGDDLDDLDEADFIRPSLSTKAISKSEDIPLGLSDSDLEAELRKQFAADRSKKKAKKQEREELRAQGLLGKKNKFKPDLSARYNDGLSMQQFREELEEFLFNGNDSLALPPMAKRERKIIHEIASQFNLKSKSVGSGKSRFPILYKTSRSIDFDATIFNRAERRFQRGYLPRMDTAAKGKTKMPPRRIGGGGVISGTGYAEGEAVGATAPELSSDNRGRAMLEKMGWSSGMALGALDNKGILQPISHIVKKTRAGLG